MREVFLSLQDLPQKKFKHCANNTKLILKSAKGGMTDTALLGMNTEKRNFVKCIILSRL